MRWLGVLRIKTISQKLLTLNVNFLPTIVNSKIVQIV
jgi:hypothetical protein